MPITQQDQKWLDRRDENTFHEKEFIDAVFDNIENDHRRGLVKIAHDDRAASLEAALVRFFIESREG
jgi:hypothetical protein